jgi:hypothetical protein
VDYTTSTTTSGGGAYLFSNLVAGTYTVSVTGGLPGGTSPTYDLDGTGTPDTTAAVLTAGEDKDDVDFSYTGTGSIGDFVWFDANGDGAQDPGEPGLQGVTMTLELDLDGDGNPDYTTTTTTDASGLYRFNNLLAHTYTISVDPTSLPAGMFPTYDLDGIATPHTATMALGSGQNRDDVDFGYDGLDRGEIGDYVWFDANRHGVQDTNEIGIAGAYIRLEGDINPGIPGYEYTEYTYTDATGHYLFTNLPGVDYRITVMSRPSGFNTQTYDPDGVLDNTSLYSLAANETYLDMDFGYVGSGQIGDLIWDDLNADGITDPGEPGMDGVAITLEGDLNGDGIADFTLQTTTASGGAYDFNGLPEADYTITINPATLPARYIQSGDPDGILDNSSQITLAPGSMTNLDQDFGYTLTGSIGDTIWYDANANASQDGGEPGLSGVTVTLVGDVDLDGVVDTLTTTTDGSGMYLFDTLPLGSYTITVSPSTLPGGMRPTYDADGIGTPHTTTVALAYGQDNPDIDFGYTGTGSIGDTIWQDLNRNGIQNPGEPGISGVAVTLTLDLNNDGSVDYTTTAGTNGAGMYLFTNLPAGSYTLTLDPTTLPPGMAQTYDPDGNMDGFTSLILGAGENNLDQDFGYAYPPEPPDPPKPPVPPVPPEPPVPPIPPEPPVLPQDADAFFMYRQFGDEKVDIFDYFPGPAEQLEHRALLHHIQSGSAEPGTSISLTLYDEQGNVIGTQTVMADTGGNWLAGFPAAQLYDTPHHVSIQQTASSYNMSSPGLLNMRTYYHPSFTGLLFTDTAETVDTIMAAVPSTVMDSIHKMNLSPLQIGWDRFYDYEFINPSINPSDAGH